MKNFDIICPNNSKAFSLWNRAFKQTAIKHPPVNNKIFKEIDLEHPPGLFSLSLLKVIQKAKCFAVNFLLSLR